MAAPIPANPAPTMTASNRSEVMVRRYQGYWLSLDRPGALGIEGGDAGHRAIALVPGLLRRVEHEHANGLVGHGLLRERLQLVGALVLPLVDGRGTRVVAVGHRQHRVHLAAVRLGALDGGKREDPAAGRYL